LIPVNFILKTVKALLVGVANNLILPELISNEKLARDEFVNNVPYSLKYTFVPL
jgi:hypothetical protein